MSVSRHRQPDPSDRRQVGGFASLVLFLFYFINHMVAAIETSWLGVASALYSAIDMAVVGWAAPRFCCCALQVFLRPRLWSELTHNMDTLEISTTTIFDHTSKPTRRRPDLLNRTKGPTAAYRSVNMATAGDPIPSFSTNSPSSNEMTETEGAHAAAKRRHPVPGRHGRTPLRARSPESHLSPPPGNRGNLNRTKTGIAGISEQDPGSQSRLWVSLARF